MRAINTHGPRGEARDMDSNTLDQAHAIARGDSGQLPTLDHLHVLMDEILRLRLENGTLYRSLKMLSESVKEHAEVLA